ncbi:MAG: pirin family protein [Candidatus Diapherotrites archaeon]|nr:pirin family protein [Candidatus Diapherotrites archaeon]
MFYVKRAHEHFHSQNEWLSSYWHFSFDHYHDPRNMNWGALRVFNDDVIQPASGFPMHSHRDMEIVTYVLDGKLAHEDSLGNKGIIHAGEVQVMSAGTEIIHSEHNASKKKELHLVQMWVIPRIRGLPPSWGQKKFSEKNRVNKLLCAVSNGSVQGSLEINQDAYFFISSLKAKKSVSHAVQKKRKLFLFIIKGKVSVQGNSGQLEVLEKQDTARGENESEVTFTALEDCEFFLWDCMDA